MTEAPIDAARWPPPLDAPPGWLEPSPGVRVLPLRTPTLPPAAHTNTVLVGDVRAWIVDPATPHPDERERLLDATRRLRADGVPIAGIVLTHHHRDHVGAARWIAERVGAPILGHPRAQERLAGHVTLDGTLDERDVLDGGGAGGRWRVLHTPGHASDHIVLWQPERRVLVAGDMIAGVGTVVVAPPDGHMGSYITQLRRLAALSPALAIPAHGPPITAPVAWLERYVAHRLAREARVEDALDDTPRTLMAITRDAYADTPAAPLALASRSALAHLEKLAEERRARRIDRDRWSRAG